VLAACYLLPAVCMPCKRLAVSVRVGRAALHHLPSRGGGGRFFGRQEGAQPPPYLELAPHPPHPVCLSRVVARVSWLQARLCASRSALTAAHRPPASPTLPPLPLLPPLPSSSLVCVPARASSGPTWALAAGGGWCSCMGMPPPTPGGAEAAPAGSAPARWTPTVMAGAGAAAAAHLSGHCVGLRVVLVCAENRKCM